MSSLKRKWWDIEEIGNGPMFCGSGVVFGLVVIWYGGRTLASKRSGYSRILVRGRWDVIPGVLRPDIIVLGQEPVLMKGKTTCEGVIFTDTAGTFLEPKAGFCVRISRTDDDRLGIISCPLLDG